MLRLLACLVAVGASAGAEDPPQPVSHDWFPRVHYTPSCFRKGGPHDIAGTLWHEPTKTYHVMAGCWSSGGWQHLTSKDLITWTEHGKPQAFGGTGGMTQDDDGTIVAYAVVGSQLNFWTASNGTATQWTESETAVSCDFWAESCNDPIVWKDGAEWYAVTASRGSNVTANFHGYEQFYRSPALVGPKANWSRIATPFFTNTASQLVPGHPQVREFVSPDFFQHIPGHGNASTSVFQTSIYGEMINVSGVPRKGLYNFAMFFVGSQPAGPGTPFVSARTQAVDWSCFSPSNVTQGGLDLAYDWGPTQFGCCPKSVGGPEVAPGQPRRIMFGWHQNGNSDDRTPHPNSSENTMTLPRELTLSPEGELLQRYIPELQQLRLSGPTGHWHGAAVPFPADGAPLPAPASGNQLEIAATIKFSSTAVGRFGLRVLSGTSPVLEYTEIGLDLAHGRAYVDRTLSSGGEQDVDVRAGPWKPRPDGLVDVHAYVDHSIVTVIVDNRTTLSVLVHPQSNASTGVALFAVGGGAVEAQTIDIWQLRDSQPLSGSQPLLV